MFYSHTTFTNQSRCRRASKAVYFADMSSFQELVQINYHGYYLHLIPSGINSDVVMFHRHRFIVTNSKEKLNESGVGLMRPGVSNILLPDIKKSVFIMLSVSSWIISLFSIHFTLGAGIAGGRLFSFSLLHVITI